MQTVVSFTLVKFRFGWLGIGGVACYDGCNNEIPGNQIEHTPNEFEICSIAGFIVWDGY